MPKTRTNKTCCVLDAKGKKVACYTSEKAAAVMQRIVTRSKTRVACKVPRRGKR